MWWILWTAWTFLIIAITTLPVEYFVGHAHWDMVRWIPFYDHPIAPFDMIANMALFVPFGYLLERAWSFRSGRHAWLLTLLFAGAISAAVEFYQVFCHNRIPSTTDIVTNVLGAISGAALCRNSRFGVIIDPSPHIR
jgi:glycopeptide antibiotics resistance protein